MISSYYIALHAFMMIFFAVRIIKLRWKHRVSLGHGEENELLTATRVFGNHNEYSPLFLIILFAIEFQGAPVMIIHSLASLFTLGRISHAFGLKHNAATAGRKLGMIITFLCLGVGAVYLVVQNI